MKYCLNMDQFLPIFKFQVNFKLLQYFQLNFQPDLIYHHFNLDFLGLEFQQLAPEVFVLHHDAQSLLVAILLMIPKDYHQQQIFKEFTLLQFFILPQFH